MLDCLLHNCLIAISIGKQAPEQVSIWGLILAVVFAVLIGERLGALFASFWEDDEEPRGASIVAGVHTEATPHGSDKAE